MFTRWILLLHRLALVFILYTLLRGLFLFCNRRLFRDIGIEQIGLAFLQGLRFDLSAIVAINFLFIFLTFLPRRLEPPLVYERLLKWVFLVLNIPFVIFNIVDLEYFQFTGRRSTLALAFMAGDVGVRISSLVFYYWPLLLILVVLVPQLFVFYGRRTAPGNPNSELLPAGAWLLNLLLIFPLVFIAFRGGVQSRPLSAAQAMSDGPGQLGQLALNSSFTLLKSYHQVEVRRFDYFQDDRELREFLRSLTGGQKTIPDEPHRDNIVLLVLESFSAEYCGAGNAGPSYTPFLDSLAAESLFFFHNYANGRRSIEMAPSILGGLPSLMAESFLESAYSKNDLVGLGTLLAPLGYTTSFFHGAANGTMRFDALMRRAGIQRYYGLNEYPDRAADFDGNWGIYDEPYLQFVARELSRQKPPFAAAIFTLSSHHPYSVPVKYRGRFNKGTLAIHESIGYTDFAVGQFFATARQQSWYSNTLFIITGDHTSKLETAEYLNPLGQYRVPLLFFHPRGKIAGVDSQRVTQHADILPSVLDYLQVRPNRRLLFGTSIFRQSAGRAFLHIYEEYWLVRGTNAFEFAPGGPSRMFDLAKDPQLRSPLPVNSDRARALEKEAKALVQYFNNGMLDNKLYDGGSQVSEASNR